MHNDVTCRKIIIVVRSNFFNRYGAVWWATVTSDTTKATLYFGNLTRFYFGLDRINVLYFLHSLTSNLWQYVRQYFPVTTILSASFINQNFRRTTSLSFSLPPCSIISLCLLLLLLLHFSYIFLFFFFFSYSVLFLRDIFIEERNQSRTGAWVPQK